MVLPRGRRPHAPPSSSLLLDSLSGSDESGGRVHQVPKPWSLDAPYQHGQLAEQNAQFARRPLFLQQDTSDRRELLETGEALVVSEREIKKVFHLFGYI